MEIKEVYKILNSYKNLQVRLRIAKITKNKAEIKEFEKETERWNALISDIYSNKSHLASLVLNEYYYKGTQLRALAEELGYSYDYILEVKHNACEYVLKNNLISKYLKK